MEKGNKSCYELKNPLSANALRENVTRGIRGPPEAPSNLDFFFDFFLLILLCN